MSNLVVVASVCACKHNVNHFSPIMVESWPWHPIANLRSWPQATTKTPSVFQISWRTKVYTTKQVIWTLCVPDISPKSRVGWDKFIKTNLTGADERLCVRSVRAALQWLLFLLAALVVFLLSAFFFMCHFRMARSQIPLMECSFSSDVSRQSEGSCFLESVEGKEDD